MKKYLSILLFVFLLPAWSNTYSQSSEAKDQIQKLATLIQIIDYAYVDTVNLPVLVEDAIEATLRELDPHSAYISAEDVEKANEPLEGSFEGIGVTFQLFNDTILVISPVPGGPSDKLGIMAGDKIVKIDGKNATGKNISNQWVMDHLRGEKGTKVDVSIVRKGRKGFLDYTITRDKIPLNSIDATYMAAPEIGYIKLNRFARASDDEFKDAVSELREQGMKKLILDLRGNSGGYLGSAIDLADEFLGFGKLIVYTQGENSSRQEYKATPLGSFEEGKLIIMVNEGSASASEIVAGAVQDWDRGLIVGRRSFGKGLVQRPFPMPDGSLIRLTTARYHTPTGRCIQRPYEDGIEEYYDEFRERFDNGEMVSADSIKFPDSLKYKTPEGRIVYGGGGIMPDVFIPWDSTWYSNYYADLRRKGVLNQFTVDYVDKHRTEILEDYPDLDSFKKGFQWNESLEKVFMKLAEDENVEFDAEGWEKSGPTIRSQVRALIARNIWDVNAYYYIIQEIDDELIQSIEILDKEILFDKLSLN